VVQRIKAARPEATIGADLIAGFPTETEEMFLNSLKLLNDCDVIAAHIFPFSPRPETPAARMPHVPRQVIKARAERLRNHALERRKRWLNNLVGSTLPALIEGNGTGHSDNFAPISVPGARRGDSGSVRIVGRLSDGVSAGAGAT
jgi:threonylcarbamoyladenosine tRNA methylthiotransferase MtaB